MDFISQIILKNIHLVNLVNVIIFLFLINTLFSLFKDI